MSITHSISGSVASSAGTSIRSTWTEAGTTEINIDVQLPASSTNTLQACAFTVANLQAAYLKSDQPMTIKTNSSGSPADTITLVANEPLIYSRSRGDTNPFGTNVTAWYLTCTPSARLQALLLTT